MPKRVWILGAGASKEMGFPLGSEMLSEMDRQMLKFMQKTFMSPELVGLEKKLETVTEDREREKIANDVMEFARERASSHQDGPLLKYLWSIRNELLDGLDKLYGHQKPAAVDYEDFFTRLRLIQNGFYPKVLAEKENRYKEYALKLEVNLMRVLHWLGMRLNLKIDFSSKEARSYGKFVDMLEPKSDVVISFNTDSLLERILATRKRGVVYTRGIYPVAFDHDHINLIKPHGSFDWVIVNNEDEAKMAKSTRLFSFEQKTQPTGDVENQKIPVAVYWVDQLHRERLGDSVERPGLCLIMPPNAFKGEVRTITDSELIFFYNQGMEQIKSADRVMIVGFAVRPTDTLAATWLDIGLRGKKADQVIIVDPAEKVPEGISKNIKEFTYIQKTFHQWIENDGLESLPPLAK